ANAQQRFAPRYGEKVSDARIGSGSVDFFVGVTQFDFVIALENAEQRFACDGSAKQAGKLGGAEIADFERERLAGRVAKPFEADVMRRGELALGGDGVAGLKLAGIDAFANDALNALIRRQRVWRARGEALDGSQRFLVRSHQLHLAKHSRQRDVSAERNHEEFGVSSVL